MSDTITDKLDKIPEPTDSRYVCNNTGGVELEIGEFLYGLVRMMKPTLILETGTHIGIASLYIAAGLKKNEFGHLNTIEWEKTHLTKAKERWNMFGVNEFVTSFLISSSDFKTQEMYDIIFLDTEPNLRFGELLKFEKNLNEGGIIIIHDLGGGMCQVDNKELGFGWPFGRLPDEIVELIEMDSLRPFHFATPRGLTCFYRPREEDFGFYKK